MSDRYNYSDPPIGLNNKDEVLELHTKLTTIIESYLGEYREQVKDEIIENYNKEIKNKNIEIERLEKEVQKLNEELTSLRDRSKNRLAE